MSASFAAGQCSPTDGRRRTSCILYIDDDAQHVALMREMFGDDDIHLITAPTAELGIELARLHRPDLIIIELELPRMSGVDAISQLRICAETGSIPIVALTSTERRSVPGLSMYCRKPVQVQPFMAMVRALLSRMQQGTSACLRARRAARGGRTRTSGAAGRRAQRDPAASSL
jgi:DNA-binding response OmpR family regulator